MTIYMTARTVAGRQLSPHGGMRGMSFRGKDTKDTIFEKIIKINTYTFNFSTIDVLAVTPLHRCSGN